MNISIIIYTILLLLGFISGWLISSYKQINYKTKQLLKYGKIVSELNIAKQQIALKNYWHEECKSLNKELHNLKDINASLNADLREVNTKLESIQLHSEDKIRQIINREKHFSEQFENLANRIFEQNNIKIDYQNRQSLNSILIPLREQLDNFRCQIQNSFCQESRERHTLTHEIRNLQQLNTQMAQEAINFTRALKGDNKIQGNWGEIILTTVLESSGMREGYEYETQVSIENDINSRMQPDVIVRLPQDKDVIIDAKMTLVAYERYFRAEDEHSREIALQEHISSIRNHIRLLSRKNYQQLTSLRTLDYVLMFISIEPAFLLAINKQPELITEALHNNIMLVSPTTLLVALRTIVNLWRYEYQGRNAQKIAERASKLYDKMRLFVDDICSIGNNLDRARDNYLQAIKKLSSGKGNLLAQIETFRSLGVEIKRNINSKLIEQAISQDKDHHLCDKIKSNINQCN